MELGNGCSKRKRMRNLRSEEEDCEQSEFQELPDATPVVPIYGSVLTPNLMMLEPAQFRAYCQLRVQERRDKDFVIVSIDNEREACDVQMLKLVSAAVRELPEQESREWKSQSSIATIRSFIDVLYGGLMPTKDQFEDVEFCRLVFELRISFLMRLCNSTGLLDDDVPEELAFESSDNDLVANSSEDISSSDDEPTPPCPAEWSPPPFIIHNGFKYTLGKVYQHKRCYYYCQWRRKGPNRIGKTDTYCQASMVYDIETRKAYFVHPEHADTCTPVIAHQQKEELLVRGYIEKMIDETLTSRQIHQELLKLEQQGHLTIPESVTRSYIERLVDQNRRRRQSTSRSIFTSEQTEIDGRLFVQLESHIPFFVILATKTSIAAAEVSHELFVGKIQAPGPEGKRICVFLYQDRTHHIQFRIMAWVIFDDHMDDRHGAFIQATVRYLGWTGKNLRTITADLDGNEQVAARYLANPGSIGYISTTRTRMTQYAYERDVNKILERNKAMSDYDKFKILTDFPKMEAREIDEQVHILDQIRSTDGRRALQRWKKHFATRISQISKGRIASDKGRNRISHWFATFQVADTWASLLEQAKSLHKTQAFQDDDAPYESGEEAQQ